MDFNKLIARVKAILLTPKTEWPVIATEPTTVADLYKGYILILAAIPAVIGLLFALSFGLGRTVVGVLVQYLLSLAMIYIMALVVDMLAPTFGGQKDRVQALKAVSYSMTAAWVASIATLVPLLGFLVALAGLIYTIYLLYLGLPHTMKCPPDKAGGYTAVAVILGIIAGALVFGVFGRLAGYGTMGGVPFSATDRSDTEFDEDSTLGKLEQWSRNVEEASQDLEAAEKSGDQDAAGAALGRMMGAALGGGEVEALPPDRLKSFVPESLAGMARSSFSAERNNAMGIQVSEAAATYANDAGRSVHLEITDTGTAKGLLALAGWSGMEGESETDQGYTKTYRDDGRLIHEEWDNSSSHGAYTVVLADRFTVKVNGDADDIDELKAALNDIDMDALEALKDEGVVTN